MLKRVSVIVINPKYFFPFYLESNINDLSFVTNSLTLAFISNKNIKLSNIAFGYFF